MIVGGLVFPPSWATSEPPEPDPYPYEISVWLEWLEELIGDEPGGLRLGRKGASVMCVACDLGHPEACANQAPDYVPPNCCKCGRFVNVKTGRAYTEHDDYGGIYAYDFECARCIALDEDRS